MAANKAPIGMSFQVQRGLRTSGIRMTDAKAARQKAISAGGQDSKYGALAKKPLELHITAANATNPRPTTGDGVTILVCNSVMPQFGLPREVRKGACTCRARLN